MDWSKVVTIVCVLSVLVVLIMLYLPDSVYGKVVCVALALALLYLGSHVAAHGRSPIPEEEPGVAQTGESACRLDIERGTSLDASHDTPLDNSLVARILDNLKSDPSEQLRAMLAPSARGRWSPEALQAARLLLEQRSNKTASEPVYRTAPRAEPVQYSRERESVAPGFSRDLLSLDVGSRVYCRWRGESGTIIWWDDENERFFIRFDNAEGEWATLTMFQ